MAIGITGGNVEIIQHPPSFDQDRGDGNRYGQFTQQLSDDMSPRFLFQMEMQSLNGLLSCLLRRKTRPFVKSGRACIPGLFEVTFALPEPIL